MLPLHCAGGVERGGGRMTSWLP